MAILFERDFGRVWSDGTTSCVFASLSRAPSAEEMEELAERQLQLIRELRKKFGYVYSILDLRVCPPLPHSVIVRYISSIMPRQFKAGVKHKALIKPQERLAREIVANAIPMIEDMPISIHTSFEDALVAVRKLSVLEKPTWRNQPIVRFFSKLIHASF